MKPMMGLLILGVLATGFSGAGQAADNKRVLLPTIEVTKENIGNGAQIRLDLNDLRTEQALGFREDDGEMVPIPSDQDITEIIYYEMIEALKAKGFVVNNGLGPDTPTLTLVINTLKYTVQPNFFTKEIIITTDMKAISKNGGHTLTKGFQLEKTAKDFSLSGKAKERERVTSTISTALTDLANDTQLLKALAGTSKNSTPGQNNYPANNGGNSAPLPPPSASDGEVEAKPLEPF